MKGIYTADPRIATDARQLSVIGYEEMMELAHQGAQVMQVRAVELGWVNDVVIEVLSSFEDAPGTQIREDPLVEQRNKVRGIAHDRNVAKITLVDVPDKPGVARSVFGPLAENGINVDMIVQNVGHGGATDLSFTIPRVELAKAKRILEPLIRDLGFRDMTTDSAVAKVSIVGAGIHNAPGYAARMFGTLADGGINIEMISTSEIRITTIIAEDRVEEAVRALHIALPARAARERRGGRRGRRLISPVTEATAPAMFSRVERFASIGSTNDAVRSWLRDGTPEICLAVADEQTAGRGRLGRTWSAPPGAALLRSLGFRPTWLAPDRAWRLAATVALAMCDAAEDTAGLPVGAVRLKWPNDLVIETAGPGPSSRASWMPAAALARLAAPLGLRKLAGVLGETDGLGTDDPRVVVGIGVNADWARADFPPGHRARHDQPARGVRRPADRPRLRLLAVVRRPPGGAASPRCARATSTSPAGRSARSTTGRLVTLESGDGTGGCASARGRRRRRARAPWSRGRRRSRAASGGSRPARSCRACASRRWRCNAMVRPVLGRAGARPRPSSCSIATATSSRRPAGTLPSSTRCTGSTWPRCTPTPSTSSVTITPPRTRPSGPSCARSPRCRGSASRRAPRTAPRRPRSACGCSGSRATWWPTSAVRAAAGRPTRSSWRWGRASRSRTPRTSRRRPSPATRPRARCVPSPASRMTAAARWSCASWTR